MKRPRPFLEMGAVGIAAPLMAAGQGLEKGRWGEVSRHLPRALEMPPAVVGVRLDGARPVHRAPSLLAVIANTPRAGAGLVLAPQARVDDGLLDTLLYTEMTQTVLATHFVAIKAGTAGNDDRIRKWHGREITIRSTVPLPVAVDSKVVGSTPARFRVITGGLLVIVGNGDGLEHRAAESLVSAIKDYAELAVSTESNGEAAQPSLPGATSRSAGAELAKRSRPLGIALATGATLALLPAVSRWISRRRR
jgi:hypothetical protein